MDNRSTDITHAEALGKVAGNLSKPIVSKKDDKTKGRQFNKQTPIKKGRTPSAKNVRDALKGGYIKPEEASALNPRGGLTPSAKDVRAAVKSKKITKEEARALNPRGLKK